MHLVMRIQLFFFSFLVTFLVFCNDNKATGVDENPRRIDTTQFPDAFSLHAIDSQHINEFVTEKNISKSQGEKIATFYKNRNFQYAWFTDDGPAEHTYAFWNLHEQFIDLNKDSSVYDKALHQAMERIIEDEEMPPADELANIELHLTDHFFDYARYAYGGKLDPSKMQWHIPKARINALALLDSLVAKDGSLKDWEPVNDQYLRLREALVKLHQLERSGAWRLIEKDAAVLREGDSSQVAADLKHNLALLDIYKEGDRSPHYSPALATAVREFQQRYGLKEDGIAGSQVYDAMNVPISKRIEQVMINMERLRWLPDDPAPNRVVVNIPEFKLRGYEEGRKAIEMNVVVGKRGARTVIFSDEIEHVVFAPYWNIPRSIVREEILPAMNRNSGYLASKHMEITGRSGGLPVIRQKPGPWNALGRVKFLFPNRYAIYLHDTPAKSLFERTTRTFSHGCIRVERPADFARFLLKDQSNWSASRIRANMNASSEKWINLEKHRPVQIVYFTAWVDEDGQLNFREDVYGHDARMARQLFKS